MPHLYYCKNCKDYTLDSICKKCNENTISKYPPRFSPQDRFGEYRRKLKKIERSK
jgi:H/ACA ribonucleoprotein complex subunit 3